ncbi:dihydrofolate reductase [Myroides marinus]|uniref:dipeptidyl-peptidase 3 family protein n=1 Tax=Myroides marinus TaxID=703342 RepID=UPI002577295F|nr:dihydrofolate reductase [Myroides marinus]MDM1362560.1 dihydrofolate reductase [Myroides marinus]MDM1372996.1 dihydrofolate reductase [Myroides marinus]MDM1376646.1 dihydrofolate reductase [Myroides marinus]MDM1380327.1 dihydrofolate reductase [Myroides marinus]MDM1387599.1 dihydrofolate reductase [Myroides marinus]
MKLNTMACIVMASAMLLSCGDKKETEKGKEGVTETEQFEYSVDHFGDIEVLRYQIPGWDNLTLKEKELVYYLSQAGYAGRDIIWDQNYKHNLTIRKALESIYENYKGDKESEDWKEFVTYVKRVWFSNGIHHHYSNDKIKPGFSQAYFSILLKETNTTLDQNISNILFNDVDNKKVNLDLAKGLVKGSAVNFYGEGITEDEVEAFYNAMKSPDPDRPLSTGLNSKVVKENGKLVEKVWKSGGMYGAAIDQIIFWLEKAVTVAENQEQADALKLLIKYYQTGDLKTWDDYNIAWVKATKGNIDYNNGFIEVYADPLGHKGSYESVVQINDFDMSKKMAVVSKEAQWFEDNSPLMDAHKKKNVTGVSYKTVIVASEAGDASPSTPIGVNLPNADWIRAEHGSKSISLGNIIDSYNHAGGSDKLKEFAHDEEEIQLEEKYGELADKLHTTLHEVIGHASGQINKGVGQPKETLKSYASTLEEGRADLVGLFYLYNPKLQELGLVDDWKSVGKAAYDGYIRNGLMTQLVRLEQGADIEEAHMRNRQWVSAWVFEKGKKDNVIEKVVRDGKTYYNITNYEKLHDLFGQLLRETQRIKSEGDYNAAKALVETYGVKVDQAIHKEVLARNAKFDSAPYRGFVNPYIVPVKNNKGEVTDYKIEQPKSFEEQMLRYAKEYSFLPLVN